MLETSRCVDSDENGSLSVQLMMREMLILKINRIPQLHDMIHLSRSKRLNVYQND